MISKAFNIYPIERADKINSSLYLGPLPGFSVIILIIIDAIPTITTTRNKIFGSIFSLLIMVCLLS
jgi:hypothetical protein